MLVFMVRIWFGDSGIGSLASLETAFSGLELMMVSTSHKRLPCSRRRVSRSLHTVLICFSQTPPMWLAAGGLNSQSVCWWRSFSVILSRFISLKASRSSLFAPTKLVRVATSDKTAKCVKEAVCLERVWDFNVDGSAYHARKHYSISFAFFAPLFGHVTYGPSKSTPT